MKIVNPKDCFFEIHLDTKKCTAIHRPSDLYVTTSSEDTIGKNLDKAMSLLEAQINQTSYFRDEWFIDAPTSQLCDPRETLLNELSNEDSMRKSQEFAYSTPVNLLHQAAQQLRAKALELAIASYGESVKGATSTSIIDFSKRFYTYITKGE